MEHWSQKYLYINYSELNCAELVERVQKEVFGREYKFPQSLEQNIFEESKLIKEKLKDYVIPQKQKENFSEGDLIVMHADRRMAHVGVYCVINNKPYCLHSLKKTGFVCLHRIRDLADLGLFLEGVYKWQKSSIKKTV